MRIKDGEIIYEGPGWRITISPTPDRLKEAMAAKDFDTASEVA